jgi:hypothetical protein
MLSVTWDIGRETLSDAVTVIVFALCLGLISVRHWNALYAMLAAGALGAALKLTGG